MFLHLSFLIELLEFTSSSCAYRTEKLSQFLELLRKVKLHVAQHFLGQQAKLRVCWLENGKLTFSRAYLNSTLDKSLEKLVIFDAEFPHLQRGKIYLL